MIQVALFGAGRIGRIHAGNLVRQPGVRLKYVVDVHAGAAAELSWKSQETSFTASAVDGGTLSRADRNPAAISHATCNTVANFGPEPQSRKLAETAAHGDRRL